MTDIFISYRRADSADICDRIQDWLIRRYGTRRVFRDVSDILAGSDYVDVLNRALAQSKVVLVIIGPHWLDAVNSAGQRRLDDPTDFVRREVTAAVREERMIVPVLVQGATMPPVAALPPDIAPLAYLTPVVLRPDPWFATDIQQLYRRLAPLMAWRPASMTVAISAALALLAVLVPFAQLTFTGDTGNVTSVFVIFGVLSFFVAAIAAPIVAIQRRTGLWMSLIGATFALAIVGIIFTSISPRTLASVILFIGLTGFYVTVLAFGFFGPTRRRTPTLILGRP